MVLVSFLYISIVAWLKLEMKKVAVWTIDLAFLKANDDSFFHLLIEMENCMRCIFIVTCY